jgi:hypothetical protein
LLSRKAKLLMDLNIKFQLITYPTVINLIIMCYRSTDAGLKCST